MDRVRASPCRPAADIDAMRRADRPDKRKPSARRLELDKAEPVSLGRPHTIALVEPRHTLYTASTSW